MTLLAKLTVTNEPFGSQARYAAELANAQAAFALSRAFSSAAVAIGTTTTKVQTTATLTFLINGLFKSKAATDDFWTLSGAVVAAGSWQKYLLLIDASGAASVQEATQSTISAAAVSYNNVSGLSSWAPLLSVLNASKCVAGFLTVATDATHPFTPGTTALGATGITTTYNNGLDPYLLPVIANDTGTVVGLGG